MSFLDNLENNLKALEGREQRDPEALARYENAAEARRLTGYCWQPRNALRMPRPCSNE